MGNYAEMSLASSMRFLTESQAAISNNIANSTTSSYKRKIPLAHVEHGRFHSMLETSLPSISYREATSFTTGSERASSSMNVALGDDQYFRVQNGYGQYYTRRGELTIDGEGNLVTPNGDRYLGIEGTPIRIGEASALRVSTTGVISGTIDGEETELGRLGVYRRPDNSDFTSVGASLFTDRNGVEPAPELNPSVRQGYTEDSNVDVLSELVAMIGVQRSFSASTRAMSMLDQIQESFVTSINR